MMQERLQKVLAASGVDSRRNCEILIQDGKVKVNGEIITQLGCKVDPDQDFIEVNGKPIHKPTFRYILFNKPKGVITSVKDPQGRKVVLDFMQGIKERVYPVGRLDFDTTGLLLLTNDGGLANKITHPRFEIDKVYVATVRGIPSEQTLKQLAAGVRLEDGLTSPGQAQLLSIEPEKKQATIQLTIHEGKNRQVRRMCETVGHPVIKLQRIQLGFLTLGALKPGEYRNLTATEVEKLRALLAH
jgi:23S rRNA pseudouridine2605 synthase